MTRIVVDARPVHPGMTGIGRYARNLLGSLDLLTGIEAVALVQAAGVEMTRGLKRVRVRGIDSPGPGWDEFALPEFLLGLDADLYHSPLFALPAVRPCPAIVTIHDAIPRARPDLTTPEFRTFFEGHAPKAARAAACVVAPSEFSAREIARAVPEAEGKVVALPEPVSCEFRRPSETEMGARLRGLGLEPGYVLFVGALDHRKGLADLLSAWADLGSRVATGPGLVIAGARAGREFDLEGEILRRGLAGQVRALGRVGDEDLPALYAGAVVFVFPTHYEGFGLPILEAMACGTPVVATATTAVPEVAGGAAALVPPGDAVALAAAIGRLLSDGGERRKFSDLGLRRAAEFTLQRQAEGLERLYRSILEGER